MTETSHELLDLLKSAHVLRSMDEAVVSQRRDDGGWSKKEILGHLVDSAVNNLHRFVRMQLQPVLEFPSYDQPGWVRVQQYQERPWNELIDLWVTLNNHLAHVIKHLEPEALENRWRAPEGELTLRFVATDYLRHLRHHLRQLGVDV